MQKFIYRIIRLILESQAKKHKRRLAGAKTTFKTAGNVISFNEAADLKLNAHTNNAKGKLEEDIKKIVKKHLNNPEALLEFVEKKNTPVHRIAHADKILSIISEEEGFISPLSGFKAFYLNFIISLNSKKRVYFSLKTDGMFVLRPLEVDIYSAIHQFHKWYSYKNNLPGFECDTQSKFKKTLKTLSDNDIRDFSLGELVSIKEAVSRDVEAIDFVVDLAKEVDSTKKLLKKIRAGESIRL